MNIENCQTEDSQGVSDIKSIGLPIIGIMVLGLTIGIYFGHLASELKQARIDAACNDFEMLVAKVMLDPSLGDSSEIERPYICPLPNIEISK